MLNPALIYRDKLLAMLLLVLFAGSAGAATVYKWLDEKGTVHLSSEKPPAGIKFERVEIASTPSRPRSGSPSTSTKSAPATAAQVAQRTEVLSGFRNRECVISLESLDRKTSAAEPTSATEIRRLQETVEANCSKDPASRQQQEDMAARLRIANGPACLDARNKLGTMLEPGSKIPREQLRAQQAFVNEHCIPPVR